MRIEQAIQRLPAELVGRDPVAVATAAVQSGGGGGGGGAGAAAWEAGDAGSRWWEEKGAERQTDARAGE